MKDEILKLALEALEGVVKNCWRDIPSWRLDEIKEQITAIKQALAAQQEHEPENEPYVSLASVQEPVQEPVQKPLTWLKTIETPGGFGKFAEAKPNEKGAKPVYLTPPAAQRQWVGLTDEDKLHIEIMGGKSDVMLADMVEAKLKEKNT
jgi:hypothetical protein